MTDSLLAILITVGIFVLLALWVPCLHLCHRCVRKISRRNLPVIAIAAGCVLALPGVASCQLTAVNRITTVAGNGIAAGSGDGGPATSASLNFPKGIAVDTLGNVYIADQQDSVIRKVTASTGIITTVAGNGTRGFAGDGGSAITAELNAPGNVAVDASGNLYISDYGNKRVRKVNSATGIVTTIAGGGAASGDGVAATSIALTSVAGIGIDTYGNVFIAEPTNNKVRRVDAVTGIIATVAGTGVAGYLGDGAAATSAQLNDPLDVCVDTFGNIYIDDNGNIEIRKINGSTGVITTYAGSGNAGTGGSGDGGPATNAGFLNIFGIAVDASGTLYITDTQNGRLRKVDPQTGIISTVVGGGSTPYTTGGGAANQTATVNPVDVATDSLGNIFVTDNLTYQVLKVSPLSFPTTAVGSTSTTQTLLLQATSAETIISPLVIPASQGGKQEYTVASTSGCSFNSPIAAGTICSVSLNFTPAYPGQRGVPLQVTTTAGSINLPLAGVGTAPLVALSPGLISTIAGGCTTGCSAQDADGVLASNEPLSPVYDVKVNSAGDIYFSDQLGVRKISAATGIVTTVSNAGTNFALDNLGNLYIQFFSNYGGDTSVSKVNGATGATTVIAGKQGLNSSTTGTYGNIPTAGVPATQSYLPQAKDVEVDPAGNIYLSTSTQILRIDAATDILTYVTGSPTAKGYSGDGGLATAALVSSPLGMVFDQAGNLYFSDSGNYVVRRIDAITGNLTTYAGSPSGTENEAYVGPATGTNISPQGLAIDSAGNLYINDQIDRFLGIRRVDASTNIMTTIAGYDPFDSFSGYTARATDRTNVSGFALDSLGDPITFTQGLTGGTISKIDVSTSLIDFPYTFRNQQGPVPPVGTAYPNAALDMVNVTNIGNLPLSILTPITGQNPAVTGSAYQLDDPATAGCTTLSSSSANVSLASGTSCFLAVDFTPTAATNPGKIVLTDNALNAAAATQTVTLTGQGIAATTVVTLSLSPSAVSFPDTQSGGASASQTITVSNTGSATANITALSLGGADPTAFSQTNNCGMTLANGSSCAIAVTFTPTANRTFNASVSVASNDPNSPVLATLTGNGLPAGALTISPTTQVFPSTKVGQVSNSQTSTINNTTAQAIYLSSGSLTDATDFIQSDNCSGLVGAGKTCTVSFSFSPQSTGLLASTYAIHDLNNPGSPLTVALSGPGASAGVGAITLTPSAIVFTTTAGVTATSQSVTLTNTGTAQVTLGTAPVSVSGANANVFQGSAGFCGYTLAVGASCNANVSLTSTTVGTYSAVFNVTYYSTTTTLVTASAPLTGTVAGAAGASLQPASLNFTTNVGTAPATQTATLTNNGTAALTIASIALGGPNGGSFSIATNTCGTSLAVGSSCNLTIALTASSVGSYSATLTATDTASPTTQTAVLTGTISGVAQASLQPGTLTYTAVSGSTSAVQTATLSNPGSATLSISSVGLTGASANLFQLTANTCGTALAAGGSCTVGIVFSPTAVGGFGAALSVVDAVGSQTTILNGTATAPPALPDFTISATPSTQSTYRGRNITYTLQLASVVATNPFRNAVTLSVAGLPTGVTASFSPVSVVPGSATATSALTLTIPALVSESAPPQRPGRQGSSPAGSVGVSIACLLAGALLLRRRRIAPRLLTVMLLCGLGALAASTTGCGTGAGFSIPSSTSTLTVTGTSGTTVHSTTITLTIQ